MDQGTSNPTEPEFQYDSMVERIGRAHLAHRLHMQSHWVSHVMGHGLTYFHIENTLWLHWLIRFSVRCVGLYGQGQRHALNTEVRTNRVVIRGWPRAFDGFTILQLSDLHLDISPALPDAIARVVAPLTYDLCVLTGDFRSKTHGPIGPALAAFQRLRPALHGDIYAVLGNHDFIEMVPPLEAMGVRFLLNESVPLRRGTDSICLAGVDDPHFYEADNIQKVATHLEHGTSGILLAHSPEIYRKAAACGFDLVLSGHTHAGQICLPGGIPLLINARAPRRFKRGAWRHQELQGYTSAGAGCSGVDVRFFCRPEVTLHTIQGTHT
jgi:predicted MPP superfamily phosphohydrolase